jgi:hypothetical protein
MPTREDYARLGLADPTTGQPIDPLAGAGAAPEGFTPGTVDNWNEASEERALAAEGQLQGSGGPAGPWDTEANPHKKRADELEARLRENNPQYSPDQLLAAAQEQHRVWAAEAWDMAVRGGMDPKLAQAVIEAKKGELDKTAELEVHRAAALPLVRRGAADDIAAQFSDKKLGVVVNADELSGERSLDGMRARAKALAESRTRSAQDNRYEARQRGAVDRAESGPVASGRSRVPENITPVRRIAYGVERGHL